MSKLIDNLVDGRVLYNFCKASSDEQKVMIKMYPDIPFELLMANGIKRAMEVSGKDIRFTYNRSNISVKIVVEGVNGRIEWTPSMIKAILDL